MACRLILVITVVTLLAGEVTGWWSASCQASVSSGCQQP